MKRSQPLVGQSSPYCRDMWGRYCCLTSFFPIVDTCLSWEDIAQRSCRMVPRWRIFGNFLGPAFPASCVQHISDLHSKFEHLGTLLQSSTSQQTPGTQPYLTCGQPICYLAESFSTSTKMTRGYSVEHILRHATCYYWQAADALSLSTNPNHNLPKFNSSLL